MPILLGVDLETTGTDASDAEITEIGQITFDTCSQQMVRIYSTLVKPLGLIPEEVQAMTWISQELVDRFGVPWSVALSAWNEMQGEADYLVGHNIKAFDALIIARLGGKTSKPMIDTLTDLPLGGKVSFKKLGHLALDICGFTNPFPHRAATDVMTTLTLLNAYPIEEIIERAVADSKIAVAKLKKEDSKFETKKREIKNRGYKWVGSPDYQWQKSIKDFEARIEKDAAKRIGVRITIQS